MKLKHRALTSLAAACAALMLAPAAPAQDKKVDPSGTWTWTVPGRNGGPDRTSTLKLKMDGDKVTGKMTAPGRQGGESRDTDIEDATLKGDEISFKVTREFNGNKITMKYNGKVSADSIKGKTEVERDGQTQSRDWEAKRQAAAK